MNHIEKIILLLVCRPGFPGLEPDCPGQLFFKKNQNNVVLVKKLNKNQRVATRFLTGSCRVNWITESHRNFLPMFFLQPGPVPAPGRPAGLDQVLKL